METTDKYTFFGYIDNIAIARGPLTSLYVKEGEYFYSILNETKDKIVAFTLLTNGLKSFKHDIITEVTGGEKKAVGDTPVWVYKNMNTDPVITFHSTYESMPNKKNKSKNQP